MSWLSIYSSGFYTCHAGVVLDRKAELGAERAVGLEAVALIVLLVQSTRVVRIRASNAHAALVVEHGQQAFLLAFDEVQTVLPRAQKRRNAPNAKARPSQHGKPLDVLSG